MIPLRVLILEDNPADAELVVHELRQAGFEPSFERVDTEVDFRARLRGDLDVILADYHLPQYDALRALKHLQETGLDIPFIVVTGSIGEEKAVGCIQEGATDYLLKNRLARLGHAVERALKQTRVLREKRQTENQLLLVTRALEAAANGVMITDRNGTILWVNPAFTTLTGFPRESVIGQTPRILKSGAQNDDFYKDMWATVLSGNTWQGELVNRRRSGGLFNEEMTITPLRDPRGDIQHFIAIKQDVTTRRNMEEAMRDSQERYRILFNEMFNGFALLEAISGPTDDADDLYFLAINPAFRRLTGMNKADLQGKRIREVLPDADPDWIKTLHRVAMTRAPAHFEHFLQSFDRHFEMTVFSPKAGQCAIVFADVTERKRAEEAMQQHRNFLQTMIDHLPVAVYAKNAEDGRFVLWNAASERLFGLSASEIIGRTDYDLFPQDKADVFQQRDQAIFRERKIEDLPDDPVNSARLGRRVVHTIRVPVFDEQDKPMYLLGISEDVTEQKILEGRLLQSQKLETMGRLAGGVAHDFNNMLQVIRGYSKLLLKRLGEKDPMREYIQEIRKAEEQASALTGQLLAFSRRQILQLKVINLNEVIHEMQKMLCRLIGEDIELVTQLDPQLGSIKGDLTQMEQVIMNLAINARDAMPRGGRLILETANHQVDEAEATAHPELRAGPYILLKVADTGTGMDPNTLNHIFEPFFTTKEKEKGTGLGLSTVYGVIHQSDGHILVTSEPGQGTTFRLFLPRADEPAQSLLPHRDHHRSTAHGTGTILLVEDEAGVRKLVAEILRTSGYTVLVAHHARDALSTAERHSGPIDLLITDVIMPDMNGREVADQLLAVRPDMKVLFMTGFTGDAILRYGGPDSFKPVIRKPFSPEALTRKVRELVGRHMLPVGRKPAKKSRKTKS